MAVFPLYRDFFRFLQALQGDADPWELYQKIYLGPHKRFFRAYWSTFFPHMDLGTLQDRVRQVRRGHYVALEHLVSGQQLEPKVQEVLSRCLFLLPRFPEPDVYLMVGFFSPDGFILDEDSGIVIGIGLDRYKDFRLLDIILAHEYCHYARHLVLGSSAFPEKETLAQKLLAEGLSVCFSRRVYPQRAMSDHLLMSRRRLNWCQENTQRLESLAREGLDSPQLVPVFFGRGQPDAGIPPRVGMYMGYRLVEKVLQERGTEALEGLLSIPDIAALWPWGEEGTTFDLKY